ncbi:InlB B-repeat-containing protein [Ruminococcoides intestinale]|uniref:InlB B-repeat-containing protein n=1 Tax=Ruminococcoides intestinale TaxID=3133162 RepID=UPI0032D2566F
MKERFALLAAYFKEKLAIGKKSGKEKRKSMILSIVALVEVLAIAIVSVSAWVETISTIKLDLNNGTIDNYVFTNANIGYGNGYDGKTIDLTKYFRQAGDVHLASATSANGTDVYFPTLTANGEPSATYRKATVNDKNVNYIDFSFNVTAKGTKASFYFEKIPTIKVNDADADEEKLRVSFVCDGSNTVVCGKSDSTAEVVSGTNLNTTKQENVKSFGSYTGSTAESPLFTVPADSKPHKVTMRVWLQDDSRKTKYAGQTVTIDNFKLITQSPQAGELTFYDKTTGDPSLGAGWATKNNRAIWIYQDGKSECEKLSKDSSGNYFIKLGSDYTDNPNVAVTFYSCESTVTSNPQKSYVAKWTTTLQTAVEAESQTFTAYGYRDSSNNGYGTWGEVQKILLSSEDSSTLPMKQVDGKYLAVDMYVQGSSTPIAMTFEPNENPSLSGWVAYLPNPNSDAAHSITFKFTYKGKDYSISAPNRNSSVNYVITSQNTGYWAPPAIVSVYSTCTDEKDNNAPMGTVSVTGGMDGATRVKVTEGTTVTLNATPTDSNKYRFIGWYSDPEFKAPVPLNNGTYTANDTSAEHKFYAKFQRQYKVEAKAVSDGAVANSTGGTVKISGGEEGAYTVGSYLEGQNTSITATPKEGYDFNGWYSDEKCTKLESQDLTLSIKNIQANHLYYAKFMIKQFSVTAVANHPNDKKNSTVQFSSPSSAASNTSVTVKVNYNGSATFVANAGEGYEFVGWYSDENCQTLVSKTTPYKVSSIKADYTLYAKFKIINLNLKVYSVTEGKINGAGGTVQLGADTPAAKIETTVEWGTLATLTAKANANYEFKGWFTDPQCNIKADSKILNDCQYTDKTVETAAIKKDLTLYAEFSDVSSRKVTANAVFGGNIVDTAGTVKAGDSQEGATSTAEVTNGNSVTLVANTKPNYKFMGWYSDRECTNSVASEQQLVLTNVDAGCEYYALFKLQSFSVNAVVDGDSVGTVKFTAPEEVGPSTAVTVSVDYDGSATFVANPAEGYDFDGWYNDSSVTPVSNKATYVCENIKDSFTLHARFKLKEFEVKASAVLNGAVSNACGTVQAGDKTAASTVSTVAKWGESVALTATPKSGYSFSGWYTDLGCTQPYTDNYKNNPLTTVIKANTTVYAKFEQKRVLYLQLNSAWKTSNARYAAYVWTSGKEQWFDLFQEDGDVYRVELTAEATSWSNIIFVKMKPNTTGNNWDNKDAQTEDLKIQPQSANTDCFKITGNQSEGKATGTWKKYPFDTFTVVLDAVSYVSAGSTETNGFTGGKVSVGGVVHTSAVTNTYSDPTTVTATAVCNEGYQFAGWYSDSDCIHEVAGNAELSISVNSSVHYYAKFVKSSTKVMYFVPNTNWTKNKNERFAAYVYEKSTGDGKWYSMTEDAAHNCYTFTMDASGKYDRIIFSRMNGSKTENSWDNEWNRTPGAHGGKVEGIAIPTDGTNCFVQGTGNGGWDNCGGSWTTK